MSGPLAESASREHYIVPVNLEAANQSYDVGRKVVPRIANIEDAACLSAFSGLDRPAIDCFDATCERTEKVQVEMQWNFLLSPFRYVVFFPEVSVYGEMERGPPPTNVSDTLGREGQNGTALNSPT